MEEQSERRRYENLVEDELLELAASGLSFGSQRRAIEEILRREYEWIRRACSFVVHDADHAAECLQEALFEIAKSLPRFRGGSALRTWMFVIVRRLGRRRQRRRWLLEKRFPLGREGDAATSAHGIATERTADVELELDQEQRKLWALVRELPEKQRLSVMLHYGEDLPVAEVAHSLECSVSAVKTHLSRAREKLRKRLEEEGKT